MFRSPPLPAPIQPPAGTRDLRLDFFRGLALWWIFLDHIPDNFFSWLTVRNVGFSDATEIFVFISGYAAALAYRRPLQQQGFGFTTLHVWRRCWQLYVAHLILFLFYTAQISYVAEHFGNPMYMDEMNVTRLLDAPHLALLEALLLEFRPANMDVLPMYIVLLLGFPPLLWLLLRRPSAALAISLALFVAVRFTELNLPAYPPGNGWYFNPFAWQFLFVIGAWCALHPAVGKWPAGWRRAVDVAAAVYLAAAAVVVASWSVPAVEAWIPGWLADWMYPIDKTSLDTLRLAHFLALAHLTLRCVPRDAHWLARRWVRPLIVCGRHSLHVFCLGIFLSFAGHLVLIEFNGSVAAQLAVSVAGIAAMCALAYVLSWYGGRVRSAALRKRELEAR
ncbi:OpgC family protein [Pseudothauera rhizosphaerae]|uniref:OpgC domain-containing protein n=1 Tax=Pseudothauera rhizosphaerae TaxID=2565932 RepID=A0A4S4AQZ5_9RHOO|nr:OpgC domain-containing protein [Pseudothauera rhizosphaerae]THF61622.1 OpgC domain-containing protein [Pseudothauera rhizosphaerae]